MTSSLNLNIFVVRKSADSAAYLIFDGREASALRSNAFRIFSNFIGTRTKDNSRELDESLPLQLSLVEVCNLVETFPQRVNLFETVGDDSSGDLEQFKKYLADYEELFRARQLEEFRSKRVEELLNKRDFILDGKRTKLNKRLKEIDAQLESLENSESLIEQRKEIEKEIENLENEFEKELDAIKTSTQFESAYAEIFVKTPQFYESILKLHPIDRIQFALSTSNVYNSCKYQAYKYFWSSGYYLTGGAKFGGDFLVYPDEPSRFHSQFILVCMEDEAEFNSLSLRQLITYARMATSVKKTFVLACLFEETKQSRKQRLFTTKINERFQLGLISINWSHI